MKGVVALFLMCVLCPGLAAIQQRPQNANPIHCHLGIDCYFPVLPRSGGKSGECRGYTAYASVKLWSHVRLSITVDLKYVNTFMASRW